MKKHGLAEPSLTTGAQTNNRLTLTELMSLAFRSNVQRVFVYVILLAGLLTWLYGMLNVTPRYQQLGGNGLNKFTGDLRQLHRDDARLNPEQPGRRRNVLNTEACFIPDISPFDPSVLQFFEMNAPLNCGDDVRLTYSSSDRVHINKSVANLPRYRGKIHHCVFQPIFRPKYSPKDHNFYKYLKASSPFNETSEKVEQEYIRVECFDGKSNRTYVNFHTFLLTNKTVDADYKRRFENHTNGRNPKESLNVIIVGIDSIARANFLRTMPKTYSLLKSRLNLLEFEGYNIIGSNTYPNTLPWLTGVHEKDFDIKLPFDPMQNRTLWYQFQKAGYKSLYAEDQPYISVFDYLKKGFRIPPTDVFSRPYMLAINDEAGIWTEGHFCALNRSQIVFLTEHLLQFHDYNKGKPVFSFTFLTRVTHDYLNHPTLVDHIYADFFETMHAKGHLDNAMLIFWSDHGLRYGQIRQTYVGRHEWKRPFMFMALPKWFQSAYPAEWKNLVTNQRRLIVPHDIYITLLDILYLNTKDPYRVKLSTLGKSLLKEVPKDRVCTDAGILDDFCPCLSNVHIDVSNSSEARTAAEFIINTINKDIVGDKRRPICHELKLEKIGFAELKNETKNTDEVLITLTVGAQPGNADFEGTVLMVAGKPRAILGSLIRVSVYKGQDTCIVNDRNLKNFCVCKDQVPG